MRLFRRERGEREAVKVDSMTKESKKEQRDRFEEDFGRWIVQVEGEIESTRRSEQLTKEDFTIRINAQS